MLKVLLVEDDETLAALVSELLGGLGLDVRHAARRDSALELATGWHPDLLVTDLLVGADPGRAWGEVETLRGAAGSPPILVMTGHASGVDEGRARGIPVLAKPFDLDEFEGAVSRLIPR